MKILDLTLEQETVLVKSTGEPDVFIYAYAGTGYKEWKPVFAMTHVEFAEREYPAWQAKVQERYPSAIMMRVYRVKEK